MFAHRIKLFGCEELAWNSESFWGEECLKDIKESRDELSNCLWWWKDIVQCPTLQNAQHESLIIAH